MTALPRRINPHGKVQSRAAADQRRTRLALAVRSRGVCEASDCGNAATECAHMFGRRHLVRAEFANTPELCAALCRPCHQACDRNLNLDLLWALRSVAVDRFIARHRIDLPPGLSPLEAIRYCERLLMPNPNQPPEQGAN